MSFNYTNPFQAAPPRSTFTAASSSSAGYQVLFGGLPLDVSEKDIRDLLINEPLALAASTTTVKSLFNNSGQPLGVALVQVAHDVDAERIRREYSGQIIDGQYRLTVQHVLAPTQPLPAAQITPMTFTSVPTAPAVKPIPKAAAKQPVKAPAKKADGKAPGLELLGRLSKQGANPKDKQLALLAKQKANLKAAGKPGAALMSRLAASPATAKAKTKTTGADKVARAKQRMEVDKPEKKIKPIKAAPKTQEQLDEEMRAYERARRFA